jgi:hypothetical protein
LSVTFKSGKDFDAALFTVRGANAQELESQLQSVEAGAILATVGRVNEQFKAQYNLGQGLGARGMDAPQAAAAPQPQQQLGWDTPATAPAPAPAAQGWSQQPAAPQAARPGVPIVLGQEAKWIDKGSWKAWADPRPAQATQHLTEKTDNPNHPGLQAGTHKFWAFVR